MVQLRLERIDDAHIKYKGVIWTRYPNSKRRQLRVYYWHHYNWKNTPRSLHREIYQDFIGPIPEDCHVHHKDGNPENNSVENLECMERRKHCGWFWHDPDNKEAQEEVRRRKREQYSDPEFRAKMSAVQMNRDPREYTCKLCGEKFMAKTTHAKWCPDCRSHMQSNYSPKFKRRYFPRKWQLERFGEVRIEPGTPLSMIK